MTELEKFIAEGLKAKKANDCMNKEEKTELLRLQAIWLKARNNYMAECKNNSDYVVKQPAFKAKEKAADIYENYRNTLINKYN